MKKYKKLKDNVNEFLEQKTNKSFLLELKVNNDIKEAKKYKSRRKLIPALTSLVVAVLLVVVGLTVWLPKQDVIPTEKHYSKDNEVQLDSSFEELNSETNFIDFVDLAYLSVLKYYDKQYDEILYFAIRGENEESFEKFKFSVDTNKEHKFNEQERQYDMEFKLGKHILEYTELFTREGEDVYSFTSYGKINTGSEIIYIEYECINFEEESFFIESLQEMLIIN